MWSRMLVIAAAGFGLTVFIPVSITATKLFQLTMAGLMWFSLLMLVRRHFKARLVFIGLNVFVLVLLLLPSRTLDRTALRSDYLTRLAGFENTPYVWGGESRTGIDCSGLPRRAWRDALFQYGLRHLDGHALRLSLEQWWFDTSAKALGEGYRGFTHSLALSGTIRTMPDESLQPGDLAITASGIHALVYLGGGRWIQADPGLGHVATLAGKQDKNPWFTSPVTMHRWSALRTP